MIAEDYCSYEVAKLLKEKGFDTFKPYGWDEEFDKERPRYFSLGFDSKEHWISCPTHQMAMKWLRENCNLAITIEYQEECSTWKWRVNFMQSSNSKHTDFKHYTYEEAVDAALKYCLENLI